jgi:hypothetical protein
MENYNSIKTKPSVPQGESPQSDFRAALSSLFYETELLEGFTDEFYKEVSRFDYVSLDDEKEGPDVKGDTKASTILNDLKTAISRIKRANRHNSEVLAKLKTL